MVARSARGWVLGFLAASMPRRRGDGGQLVLSVWSMCLSLVLGARNIYCSLPFFRFVGQILFKMKLKRIRGPGQKL